MCGSLIGKIFICAIVLHELLYIDEWIQYHKLLGFDGVLIYDNSDNYELENLPEKYPNFVNVTHFPGHLQQNAAYGHCAYTGKAFQHYEGKENWAAFIDIDEFIVLKNYTTIRDLLDDYNCIANDVGCIGLNWRFFGSSHNSNYSNEPVLKRFTRCQWRVDRFTKAICQLSLIKDFNSSVHYPDFNNQTIRRYDMGRYVLKRKARIAVTPLQL
jgi:hypothetical protein